MWSGIAAGLAAGACWGFAFVAPVALPDQSPLAVAIGRYLVYTLLCVLLLAREWRRVRPLLSGRLLRDAIALGLVGNAFYYCLLTLAVRYANSAVVSLIIGTIPLWLALIDLAHTPRTASQRRALMLALLLPLSLVATGLVLINWAGLSQLRAPHGFLVGVLLAVVAAASWTAFAVFNARVVRSLPAGSGNSNWTNLLGIGSALGFLPLLPFAGFVGGVPFTLTAGLIGWSLLLGIASSWVGSWLWNYASQRLPVGLVGQLIVAETVFALIYGFVLGWRWPSALELAAISLFVAGVMLGIRAFGRAHAQTEPVH